jgi:transmembrane sensor
MGHTMNTRSQGDQVAVAEAARWHARREQLDAEGRKEFTQWLKASPRHMREFMIMETLSDALRHVDPERKHDAHALLAEAETEVVRLHDAVAIAQTVPTVRRPRQKWTLLAAASIAVAALATWQLMPLLSGWHTVSTEIGEQRTVQLPDNSVVNLNTGSRLQIRFRGNRRDVLLKEGEAFFQIQQDAARPFRVHTRDAVVQVIGTQFNVYRRTDDTQVAVLEGRVQVSPDSNKPGSASQSTPTALSAGQALHVTRDGEVKSLAVPGIDAAIAWRQRRLIFREATLTQMAEEFNRYNRALQVRLEGLTDSAQRYTGTFDADNPRALAMLLSHQPDLTIETGAREIVIRKR